MLRRKMYDILMRWYAKTPRKAFLLAGARQVGKTFIVKQFAHDNFANVAEVNFLDNKDAAGVLQAARDTEDFIARLSLVSSSPVVLGETLIFLDEVQEAPDLLTVVKFLVEDGTYPVVLSGSMLGTELEGFRSFPVGYIHIERMFPLDFEEFCWSQGVSSAIVDDIRSAYRSRRALDEALHDRLISLFRYYVAIGGMPEAVQTYLDSSFNMGAVREVLRQVVEQYQYDISKYAKARSPQIRAVYNAVPGQLDKENKRFRMNALKEGIAYERFANDFQWLIDAAVVLPAYAVSEPKAPLGRTTQMNRFKLYECDTGILLSQYAPHVTLDVIDNAAAVNFGAVYENAVAQELSCQNPALRYFHHNRKGEVDFIVEKNDGSIVPIEVKSGKTYKLHMALNNLLGTPDYGIKEACVLSMANLDRGEREGKPVWYLPLYMVFCIAEETNGELGDVRVAPPTFGSLPASSPS